jgi:cation transport regulator ChaC
LWNPGFPVAETRVARLPGWHRSFCMSSIHHRGTPEHPGLVLALDRADGAHCDGLGFRVEARYAAQTIDYLRERELISSAYLETRVPVTFRDCGTRHRGCADLCDRPRRTSSIAAIWTLRRRRGSSPRPRAGGGPTTNTSTTPPRTWPSWDLPMPISTGWRRGCGR